VAGWICGISKCESHFETIEEILRHQIKDHSHNSCRVCGEKIPDGIFAIQHVIGKHGRREYVLAYGATSNDIRYREYVKRLVESEIDIETTYELLMSERDGEIEEFLKDD
tara:strand:- start:348 stop:677 length:330 start_codon:yes stop_codon:yes gene_type:complete